MSQHDSRPEPDPTPAGSATQTSFERTPPEELPALLEALLLVAPEPAKIQDLAGVAGVTAEDVDTTLTAMNQDTSRGWVVVRHQGSAHLSSAPRFAAQVRTFLKLERESRLSGAALETLALIAYRQPVTRAEIEALRGVDSSGVLATLHARGLIDVTGRLPTVGNPMQYATSIEFLRQFGMQSLADLPPLDSLPPGTADRLFEELPTEPEPEPSSSPSPQEEV